MATYSEPSSMIGSTGRMCADRSPVPAKPSSGPPKLDPPRRAKGLRPGTCLRCGVVVATGKAHVDANDCIAALRDALAMSLSGEVRRIGRPSKGKAIAAAKQEAENVSL
jgi:hypothetical protein